MGNVLNTAYKVVADVIDSEENINIEQGTLHVINDKLKVHLEGEIKEVSTKSYKVYTALLTQSGTDAPVATVLENTLGGEVVWERGDIGVYTGNLSNAFIENKTFFLGSVTSNAPNIFYLVDRSDSVLEFNNSEGDGFENIPIEIRVYN